MKLTRRGLAVVAVLGFALLQGYVFGERTLNYVVAPALVALVVGAVTVWRADAPTIERSAVHPGFPGEERREVISVKGSGIATVVGPLPDCVGGEAIERTGSLPVRIDREIRLHERGVYPLNPITVRQRDPLGLVTTRVEFDEPNELVVYPEVRELDRAAVTGTPLGETWNAGRRSFEWLREYRDGDPLRRIHWKSTAKHESPLVVDSTPSRRTEPVHVAVDDPASAAVADELATAAASLVFHLLDSGYRVSVTLREDRIDAGRGPRHRERVFAALAAFDERSGSDRATEGRHPDVHDDADVSIFGDEEAVTVLLGSDEYSFDRLRSGSISTPTPISKPTTNGSTPAASERVTGG